MERTAGGVVTRFVYDGDQAVEELTGSNSVSLYRTPGVGFVRNGGQHYDCENALGSSVAVRNGSGGLVGLTQYDGFGREAYASGAERGDFRFGGAHGYVNDDATGMQLLGASGTTSPRWAGSSPRTPSATREAPTSTPTATTAR